MEVTFDKSFAKDLEKLGNKQIKSRLLNLIKICEEAKSISDLPGLRKLVNFSNFYRFRIGNYRVGVEIKNNVICFITIAHRKDIYDIFP